MKCVACTDLHGSERASAALAAKVSGPGIDVFLCAGDFTQFGAHAATALRRGIPPAVKPRRVPFVLLTHYPPLWTAVDLAGARFPRGSAQVRAFVEQTAPALAVCGHNHEAFGREDRIGPTRIVNPGPEGMPVEV